ncbi:MAG: cytochrome c biogenesis protein CcdA [Candidatus Doudnabacteria bacterium]|jgi:cytochrome c biogenesis protein CcdA
MPTLVTTSLIAAFVAGVAALFAPCCISVLLPSYLGNIFKEKYKIYSMTFVFFLGILTVFLPIGLGATLLAAQFSRFHNQIFTLGGLFLIVLGISMLFGKGFSTPTSVRDRFKKHVASIYVLGIFSAIATTCCAPVLAGVLALSAASGKVIWGLVFTLAYVIGMVLPLFIVSVFLDKVDLAKKLANVKKTVQMKLLGHSWTITISELISGLIFLGMGGYITYLAFNNKVAMSSDYQLQMNLFLAGFQTKISGLTSAVPNFVWAIIIVAVFIGLIALFIKQSKSKNHEQE